MLIPSLHGYWRRLSRSAALFLLTLLLPAIAFSADFTVQNLNSDTIWWPSLALDSSGDAHLAYYFIRNQTYDAGVGYSLRHNGTWTHEVVAGVIGFYTTLALDPAGSPAVSYYDSNGPIPKYASRQNGVWTSEAIDGAADSESGGRTALDFDSQGRPHVIYQWRGVLKHAVKTDGQWTIDVIDPAMAAEWGDPGASLVIDAQDVDWVSYHNGPTLKVAQSGAGGWTLSTMAENLGYSGLTSIAMDAQGAIYVAYQDIQSFYLWLARSNGNQWAKELVALDGGFDPSLVLDGAGNPHVSYHDQSSALKYTHRVNGAWSSTLVDATVSSGYFSSLALNTAGQPEIAYKYKGRLFKALRYAVGPQSTSGVEEPSTAARIQLLPPTPNPSSGPAAFSFTLPAEGTATLELFDVTGRLVASRSSGVLPAGSHELKWDGGTVSSGLYFVRLSTDRGASAQQRWTILR